MSHNAIYVENHKPIAPMMFIGRSKPDNTGKGTLRRIISNRGFWKSLRTFRFMPFAEHCYKMDTRMTEVSYWDHKQKKWIPLSMEKVEDNRHAVVTWVNEEGIHITP
jgi:hypothetical protein